MVGRLKYIGEFEYRQVKFTVFTDVSLGYAVVFRLRTYDDSAEFTYTVHADTRCSAEEEAKRALDFLKSQ